MNNPEEFFLDENGYLAELIGILLGDGHLHKKGEKSYLGSVLSISLNRIDEPEYVEYVRSLIINLFKEEPKMHPRVDSNIKLRNKSQSLIG